MTDGPDIKWIHYVDQRIADLQRAVDIASKAQNMRLESMNEFREQLHRQAATFVTRDVFDQATKQFDLKIDPLEKFQAGLQGQIRILAALGILFNLLLGAATLYLAAR